MKNTIYKTGVDIGSTTAKIAILDSENNLIFSEYRRHNTKVYDTVFDILDKASIQLKNFKTTISITGSAGIGIAENTALKFIQEVIAATDVVKKKYPSVKTLIDIGGEDSKMIFFEEGKLPDIRMNGSCAGGTGAFIDQTASLLDVSLEDFNSLAEKHTKIYPVASRCGVFAKTDIQNLLSRKIAKEDIAASVYQAVFIQTINTLSRGSDVMPDVMLTGGPFTFMPELVKTFRKGLNLKDEQFILSENPALMSAIGAALNDDKSLLIYSVEELKTKILETSKSALTDVNTRLTPLFNSKNAFAEWKSQKVDTEVPRIAIKDYEGNAFLGIDSGSTTTKITLISDDSKLLFNFYSNNKGNAIETLQEGFKTLQKELQKHDKCKSIKIAQTAVTGYGEDLVKSAFGIDIGIVETIAHYQAAKYFNKDVSFIMDIGGQDMKAIFIKNGAVDRIELNEACSAGCGSFIETFGKSLGHSAPEFAELACTSEAPCDLGTRCTVFMNSKVKQALRENATVNDIAAGLSVSVIKNALYKVLQLKDIETLGDIIAVQGGTFKNPSVQKALEDHIGKKVICTDIPEQMGAYGAARVALAKFQKYNLKSEFIGFENLTSVEDFKTKQLTCKACENFCTVTRFTFSENRNFYSGNKCEKVFSNKGETKERGVNFYEDKLELLFNRSGKAKIENKNLKINKIGIPRVLNMFENYPFWNSLFTECGINVELSDKSTMKIAEKGKGTIMSDSICFPAKLVHGHVINLAEKGVDRIFYPLVVYEVNEFEDSENSFNCPIVGSYPEVISSSINPERKYGVPLDSPAINLDNKELLRKAMSAYLKKLGVNRKVFKNAFEKSWTDYQNFKKEVKKQGQAVINKAFAENRMLVVLAGRPYHADPLINHKTAAILADFGADVVSEDVVPSPKSQDITDLQIISQWTYPNRIYSAAQWVAEQGENVQFVQLNSFGCGPDSIVIDECAEILKESGKNHTTIRVDEISSTGSVRLRLRSMLEALSIRDNSPSTKVKRKNTAIFDKKDKQRTIIAPFFADMYSDFLPLLFATAGYKLKVLPRATKKSVQYGLKYANNEICYPATVVVGDILKYLHEEKYDPNDIAVAITQTGGACRASTYLSLIKKGMVASGFENIPVISIGTSGKVLNPQPGFEVNWKEMLPVTFLAIIYADSIAKMYYSLVVREKNKGETKKVYDFYSKALHPYILSKKTKEFPNLLKKAVIDFNKIEVNEGFYPKIGLVGEIYIKYNSFGHQFIVDWLIEQGVEVVVPPILDFFTQEFINIKVNKKNNLVKASLSDFYLYFLEKTANRHIDRANKILSKFNFYDPFHNMRHAAKKASEILSLANQFGEGWLIPAEIAGFQEQGVDNVISVQPFGCIANHVVSKGVEKRLKEKYPKLNLLFLDFDDGTSEVNIINRLHFMIKGVKESAPKPERTFENEACMKSNIKEKSKLEK